MLKTIKRRQATQQHLMALNSLSPILQHIYAARGVSDIAELDKALSALLPYNTLKDIDKAVNCLADKLIQQKRILIVGDFDADGATSTAVAVSALQAFGAQHVDFLVPNRFEYGYGLTPEIVEVASQWQPDLIITVDNGISCVRGVAAAHQKGIEVLVTDHHLPGDELPEAVAIVNPNQQGCQFPSKQLAGVGVIFYVMLALRRYLQNQNYFTEHTIDIPNMAQFLDLVALGTVADVVPLDKNNRILVHQGLSRIRAGHCRPGILALLSVAKREMSKLQASDLGFAVAPRLNAAGRLDDMSLGINCLLAEDPAQAELMAQQLDQLNIERRAIEKEMQDQAMLALEQLHLNHETLPPALCLYEENWHQGVIGILAGRIKDKIHRPVAAFAKGDPGELKGSARSIMGIHIRDVLQNISAKHPHLMKKFGGHAMAAGLSLAEENLQTFADIFQQEVKAQIAEQDLIAEIATDGALSVNELNFDFVELLQNAGPWGQQFPEPTFDGIFDIIEQRLVGQNHLKLVLSLPSSPFQVNAIAFNVDTQQWPNYKCKQIEAVYRLDINEYKGFKSVQLMVEYLQPIERS